MHSDEPESGARRAARQDPAAWRSSAPSPPGLFDGVLARGGVRDAVTDEAWLQAMLDVEAALAVALADAGLVTTAAADAVRAVAHADRFDATALGAAAADAGNPVVPLVRALCEAAGDGAVAVHRGATSQDILDTATMLVAARALQPLLADLEAAGDAAAALAAEHDDTVIAARTLLQQALPTTFGLKAAGWLSGLDESAEGLRSVRDTRLAVQLAGPAGTLASLGECGPAVVAAMARTLGLGEPDLPWHTMRNRPVALATALGEAAGVLGKIAGDVILLAQTEVAEVREGGAARGGSSSMPHKRNPIAAVSAAAATAQAPGLVATLLTAGAGHEHERAAGAWHAEWRPLTELLRSVGSAAAWVRDCLEHLDVDRARMRGNLAASGGLSLAERIAVALTPALGPLEAHDRVRRASHTALETGRPLAVVLAGDPEVAAHLDRVELDRLLEPEGYLGSAPVFVDRALRRHAARRAVHP